MVGQVMLVVRADRTPENELRAAVSLLDGCDHIQLVLNAVSFVPGGRAIRQLLRPGEKEVTRITLAVGAAAVALLASGTADAQSDRHTTVSPYIEVSQVLDADLKGGDVVTYTDVAVGIDAATSTARTQGQISYRYERRIGEGHDIGDADVNTGLARIDTKVAPGLSLDAGALATRSRSDIRGAAPGVLVGNVDNVSQVYSVYGGPSYRGHAGAVALSADYGIGYTKVTTPTTSTGAPGQRLDYYDHSLGQNASVGASVAPGTVLPVGVTVRCGLSARGWRTARPAVRGLSRARGACSRPSRRPSR